MKKISPSPDIKTTSGFSVKDITALKRDINTEMDNLEEGNPNISHDEIKKFEQRQIGLLLKELTENRDRFKYLFETEMGSIYFVLKSGESWRFKRQAEGYQIQPLLKHIFFIDQETRDQIEQEHRSEFFQEWLINKDIPAGKTPREGLYPLEFIIEGYPDFDISSTENGFQISLTPEQESKMIPGIEPQFASGHHLGHKISKIF